MQGSCEQSTEPSSPIKYLVNSRVHEQLAAFLGFSSMESLGAMTWLPRETYS